jgi:hypothetical protein
MPTKDRRANTDTAAAARRYIRQGISIIPVPRGKKAPGRTEWQKERWTLDDVAELWGDGGGVGILWGSPSGSRVDVDIDWVEVRAAARYIMRPTRTFGRPGAPESHRVYKIVGELLRGKKFEVPGKDPGRRALEILSEGQQSLVPPSFHAESGEYRRWYDERPATEITADELL